MRTATKTHSCCVTLPLPLYICTADRRRASSRARYTCNTNMAAALHKAVCIVTGGASGLGRATVQRLAQNGARVVIADLPSSDGEIVAKELGESCCFVPTDVSSAEFKYLFV